MVLHKKRRRRHLSKSRAKDKKRRKNPSKNNSKNNRILPNKKLSQRRKKIKIYIPCRRVTLKLVRSFGASKTKIEKLFGTRRLISENPS